MQCKYPLTTRNKAGILTTIGCGRCMSCRINKRQEWTGRILLEQYVSRAEGFGNGWFVTLTYNEENRPEGNNLKMKDVSNFLKRLRKNTGIKWRFFCAGEYGKKAPIYHPHYHMALFPQDRNWGPQETKINWDRTDIKYPGMTYDEVNIELEKIWGKGYVSTYELVPERAQYICQYTTKKMIGAKERTHDKKDPTYGRKSESATMSKRPGLGFRALRYFVESYERYGLIDPEEPFEDSRIFQIAETGVYRIANSVYPLPQLMKEKLVELLGIRFGSEEEDEKEETIEIRRVYKDQESKVRSAFLASPEGLEYIEQEAKKAQGKVKRADRNKEVNPQGI
jgi:hypothetical protein